ncbi:hypothetical protein [Pseudomonas sp. S11A4]|uniref:hypothetical protein n=1 Tax=Pseudomonas sp. S11A4 TaxID=1476791 RepID=UPI00215BF211|nr:hypothetical protein [Pseudomonas sp. S11A4]MCR8935667.1 hypothetical protein [Pseudomonas sp. S11A4]
MTTTELLPIDPRRQSKFHPRVGAFARLPRLRAEKEKTLQLEALAMRTGQITSNGIGGALEARLLQLIPGEGKSGRFQRD